MRKNRIQGMVNFVYGGVLLAILFTLIFYDYEELEYKLEYTTSDIVRLDSIIGVQDSIIEDLEFKANTLALIVNELTIQAPNWGARINQLKSLENEK